MKSGKDAKNIEVDVLSKYAERRQESQEKFILTEQYLIANGY
jgi:riboflavin synthase